ncbi:MAG: ABC transporter ATP-binding protein [Candidatus Aminicenantes bacterium]|nr:ABC transporter ATP-binding protein [Candidatus Aminicenantes bacterium]
MELLSVNLLEAGYPKQVVLREIRFKLEAGKFLAVCGRNGSGKSTLLRALLKLLPHLKGKIYLDSRDISQMKAREIAAITAYVPQVTEPVFNFSVEEIVSMARYFRQQIYFPRLSETDRKAVEEALILTETQNLKHKSFNHLSSGEKQRVLIARALAQDSPLILLDEPSSHLDLNFQLQVYQLLKRLQKEKGKTILVTEHNLNLCLPYCDRLIFLKNGKIMASGQPPEVVNRRILQEVFDLEVELRENSSTGLPEISLIHRREADQ